MGRATGLAAESDDLGLWPGERDEQIYMSLPSGSWDKLKDCGAHLHVVRGWAEADNSSVSDSVRPVLGHNEFGLQLLSPQTEISGRFIYMNNHE